ncbi:MAG: aldo/keto reductase [Verrucomicrobiales bacterium]
MKCRPLGVTGIEVSEISFGAGPVPALMTTADGNPLQLETVRRAVEAGLNWFDTAATYGDGRSESSLGAALRAVGADRSVYVATKARVNTGEPASLKDQVKASVRGSLRRLGRDRITLLQLHNSITRNRGDQPTSITPNDVLGSGGILKAFAELQAEGLIEHFGLTGLGDADALREVIGAGRWAAIQLCVDILRPVPQLLSLCAERGIGVIAIRVLAGGALAGQVPSTHTRTTKFFPLPVYEEDQIMAARLASSLPDGLSLTEAAMRFVLSQKQISTALVGLASPEQVDQAIRWAEAGALSEELLQKLSCSGWS